MSKTLKTFSHTILTLSLVFFSVHCSTTNVRLKKQSAPDWIENHPISSEYFIGIGSAPIIKKEYSHTEKAKKDALNELASEISVHLSSSNILVSLVKNDKLHEEFNSLIRSKVYTDLSGYELVDTYADKKTYWVYYRLSKQKYLEQQLEKKKAALSNASSFYINAQKAEELRDINLAITNYVKTIDALKLYLNEDNTTDINNEKTNLTVSAFAKLNDIISTLKITASYNKIDAKYSLDIDQKFLVYKLTNNNGNPVKNFPVTALYSERAIQESSRVTDNNGSVSFNIGKVRSQKQEESFQITPDVASIISNSTSDYTVRKAVLDIPVKTISIPIKIQKPTIRFDIIAKNINNPYVDENLYNTFRINSIASNYLISENPDYICRVNTETKAGNFSGGIYTVELTGTIQLLNNKNQIKYSIQIFPIKGLQLSQEKAGIEAYKNFQQQINSRYFRELEEAILKQ